MGTLSLFGILIITASIVFVERLPLLPIGGFSMHASDVLLLGSLGLVALGWLKYPSSRIRTPLDRPLLLFFGITLFSTLVAILQSSVDIHAALRATRVFFYYLTFFVVTNLIRERRQLNFLLNGVFLLATVVAAAMIVQYLVGDSVEIVPGRVETLNTSGTRFDAVTRIAPPGFSIVVVSFVTILCTLVVESVRPVSLLRFLQCSVIGLALLMTFLRSYWAVLILVMVLLAYLVKGADRQRLVGWGMLVMSCMVVALLVVVNNPDSRASRLLGASWDRLSTLGSSGTFQGQDGSVDWRRIESGYAVAQIASSPVLGIGMGAMYRPLDSRLDTFLANRPLRDFRRLIHNGHLTVLLQSGLLGYVCFVWLSLVFLRRGFNCWRIVSNDRDRGVVLGFTLVYLAVLIAAVSNSTFMQANWTPVIGILLGGNEVILRHSLEGTVVA